jgi:hypothetical protein
VGKKAFFKSSSLQNAVSQLLQTTVTKGLEERAFYRFGNLNRKPPIGKAQGDCFLVKDKLTQAPEEN